MAEAAAAAAAVHLERMERQVPSPESQLQLFICTVPLREGMELLLLCSHAARSNRRWNSLPQHLMDLIIEKSDGQRGDSSSVACMRLVSTSWLAAVTDHPGALQSIKVQEQDDLLRLCKLLPNMVRLEIDTRMTELKLEPLSALSKLTSFGLQAVFQYQRVGEASATISGLPENLRKLQLNSVNFPSACFGSLNLAKLRSLSLKSPGDNRAEILKLLQHLPHLQVTI